MKFLKKQEIYDVKKYLLVCLRKKYGTYAGWCGQELDLLNDEDADKIIITVEWLGETK